MQLHLIIHGRVQGVFYRTEAKNQAQELGLVGWVKNLPEGTVEVLAQGDEQKLKKLLQWCKKGSKLSRVEYIEQTLSERENDIFNDFSIV